MPRPASRPRTPRFIRTAAAIAACVFAALTCGQCRPVHDTVTGVNASVHSGYSRPPICIHGCAARFRGAHRDEELRHRRAMRACHGERVCKAVERATHRERKAVLAAARRDCHRGCYGEGAGAGGR